MPTIRKWVLALIVIGLAAGCGPSRKQLMERIAVLEGQLNQEQALREERIARMYQENNEIRDALFDCITEGGLQIKEEPRGLVITFVEQILFDSGKADIKEAALPILEQVGRILRKYFHRMVKIDGHTDNLPIHTECFPSNWELSATRATNVLRWLQEHEYLDPTMSSASGYGEYRPVASNDTPEGRAKNRRVEIVLLPEEYPWSETGLE